MRNNSIKSVYAILILSIAISASLLFGHVGSEKQESQAEESLTARVKASEPFEEVKALKIERLLSGNDKDADGIDDFEDIIQGARADAENRSIYKDAYYRGGYPPENEGVCTDVIWRAFKNSGYMLKDLLDNDIRSHTREYKRVTESGGPDPNIDFRRIPNLVVYFERYSKKLTSEILPSDEENLYEWQGGDIVVFGGRIKHIGIISDKRNKDGVPYIIHNAGPYAVEEDSLLYWNSISEITGHYRWIVE